MSCLSSGYLGVTYDLCLDDRWEDEYFWKVLIATCWLGKLEKNVVKFARTFL